ncbi:Relaxase/Mobilisation nuclease domain-containing protein [Ruminococcus sp. YRD2003]|uniref:relaxase/mobilization nuclease domain-containing protein n=1 Tax=Ruminococcus sp. YRD2003 TaxID=1452313 RepID=UPI0008D6BE5B|nr:Relaxase/Mobilisation nuclease domain-containing protein [Ruminococcus flavefaciens]
MSLILARQGDNRKTEDLRAIYDYCTDTVKTQDKRYTETLGTLTDDPLKEMIEVKRIFGKLDGRQYLQIIASPTPFNNNISDDEFMDMAKEIGDFYYALGFQCTVSVHFDTKRRHIHLISNSVSFINGKKFSQGLSQLNRFKLHCNKVFQKYGFDIVTRPTEKINDTKKYSFNDGYDFLEAFDEIADDVAFDVYDVTQNTSNGETPQARKNYNPDAPKKGFNRFFAAESETYRDYYTPRENSNEKAFDIKDAWAPKSELRPMAPFDSANILPSIVIKEQAPDNYGIVDYFEGSSGSTMHIDGRRVIDVYVPDSVKPSDISSIVTRIPSRDEKAIIKNAAAAKAGLYRSGDESPVSVNVTDQVRIHFKSGEVISDLLGNEKKKEFSFRALSEYLGHLSHILNNYRYADLSDSDDEEDED